jgi:hypothetical protein
MRRNDPRATTIAAPPRRLRSVTPIELPRPLAPRSLFERGHTGETDDALVVRLGGSSAIPVVLAGPRELRTLSIDPRLAFLLSRIDGSLTVGNLLELGVLPDDEVVLGLWTLVAMGAVSVGV